MKATIYCLLIALCLRVAWTQSVQTDPTFVDNGDRVLLVRGYVAGKTIAWLAIEAHNGQEWKQRGFDPCYTRVVSDYMPLFRKLPNGQYEIMFTSEIAKDLP